MKEFSYGPKYLKLLLACQSRDDASRSQLLIVVISTQIQRTGSLYIKSDWNKERGMGDRNRWGYRAYIGLKVDTILPSSYLHFMPRRSIIDAPSALHHIMARGKERRHVFRIDTSYNDFLDRLMLSWSKHKPCNT